MSFSGLKNIGKRIAGFISDLVEELLEEIAEELKTEVWTINTPMDCACIELEGYVFLQGEGLMPIQDTHPNCECTRVPIHVFEVSDLRRQIDKFKQAVNSLGR